MPSIVRQLLCCFILLCSVNVGGSEWLDRVDTCFAKGSTDAVLEEEVLLVIEQCPELANLLVGDPWIETLEEYTAENLPVPHLSSLADLVQIYSARPRELLPTASSLDSIISALSTEKAETLSVWDRILKWFKGKLNNTDTKFPKWIENLHIPDALFSWFFAGVCILLVVLALGMIINEIRLVRKGRHKHSIGEDSSVGVLAGETRQLAIADLYAIPLHRQPAELLKIVLAAFYRNGLLQEFKAETHRDIISSASQLTQHETSLVTIARAAERATYGKSRLLEEEVNSLKSLSQSIVEDLKEAT